jgi:hypothetical protein
MNCAQPSTQIHKQNGGGCALKRLTPTCSSQTFAQAQRLIRNCVEVPGIEPGSFGIKTGLLRA